MLDVPMIQTRGFRNTEGGFQLRLRLPYYRGLWTSLIEGATLTVDDTVVAAPQVRWTLAGEHFTLDELQTSSSTRWSVDEAAVLTAPRAEPLGLGFHEVSVELRMRMSYIPEELQPTIWSESRTLVISQ
jgi:hypothetical protein